MDKRAHKVEEITLDGHSNVLSAFLFPNDAEYNQAFRTWQATTYRSYFVCLCENDINIKFLFPRQWSERGGGRITFCSGVLVLFRGSISSGRKGAGMRYSDEPEWQLQFPPMLCVCLKLHWLLPS